jgi:NTE family protein
VLDDSPRLNALIVQIDLFSARGELPQNLNQVLERAKDIQYSSKTRFNTKRVKEIRELHELLGFVLAKLPPALRDDPDVQALRKRCDVGEITIAHLINRRLSHSVQSKDYEFSRATVNELWAAGLADVRQSVLNLEWTRPREIGLGVRVYDLTR